MKSDPSIPIESHRLRLSPKCQVVIPLALRRRLGLGAGSLLQAFAYRGRLELVPVRPIREARGLLRGMDTRLRRERDRPLAR
jgi:AbrB family looped-hinge helix DNA binding protein